jgi:2'-5' RNA ligase
VNESVVLVPVLDTGPLVRELRLQYDPSAKAGVPPHITLMFPFLPPSELTEAKVDALAVLLSGEVRFEFSLSRVSEFEQGVVYLEPEPGEPFIQLTKKIGDLFGLLPFVGEFGDTPVPHLTLTVPESRMTRDQIATQLVSLLPIPLVAHQAWLMVGSNSSTWKTVARMPFSGAV